MNSIYISDIVPKEDVKRYNASQASCNFNNHVQLLGYFDAHIAIPPTNVGNGYRCFKDESGIEYHAVRFFPHKSVLRYVNCLLENIWLYKRIKEAPEKNVWFYNISKINCYAYWLLSFFSRKSLYVLLADYNPERNKGVIGRLILRGINKAKGMISLTARCGDLNDNVLCLPGIIPLKKIAESKGTLVGNRKFMISGVLSKNTGIEMALEVFAEIPTAELVITGKGDKETELLCRRYADKYKNIRYYGFMERYDDFLSLLRQSDFILSFRDPSKSVNRYNFPSKILESLALNKVVVSTQEYAELEGVNYIYVPYEKSKIINCIEDILAGKKDDEIDDCINNSEVLREKFTENAWINAFKRIENG